MLDNHEDLATAAADIAQEISKNSRESDQIAYTKIVQYSDRTTLKENLRQQSAKDFANNSPIRKLFEETDTLENQIINEFNVLMEKYGVKNNHDNLKKEATPSASLEASPSTLLAPSSAANLDATPSAESTNSAKH